MAAVLSTVLLLTTLLHTAHEVDQAIRRQADGCFALTGTVTSARECAGISAAFSIADKTGSLTLYDIRKDLAPDFPPAGSFVCLNGHLESNARYAEPMAVADSIVRIGTGEQPTPVEANPVLIDTGIYDNRLVAVRGIVRDVFIDDIDPRTHFITLDANGEIVTLVLYARTDRTEELRVMLNCDARAEGACVKSTFSSRQLAGHVITLRQKEDIHTEKASQDPFDVTELKDFHGKSPLQISKLGRRRISGHVLAVWNGRSTLLRTTAGGTIRVELANAPLPQVGASVDVAGFCATDLFHVRLTHASWRNAVLTPLPEEIPVRTNATAFSSVHNGKSFTNPHCHGGLFSVTGTVLNEPDASAGMLTLDVEGTSVPVDVSNAEKIVQEFSAGCRVRVTGIAVVNAEIWQPLSGITHTSGVTLVIRAPSDVVLLARPPWWTPRRLVILLCLLASVLVAILVWNRFLRQVIDRRSLQLFKEEVARVGAELRIDERTRLAADLHDSLSQCLSAIACQAAALRRTIVDNPTAALYNIQVVERMLASCRTELRYSLFDLRSDMLEEQDFSQAIRLTLSQLSSKAQIHIRFNVPRTRLLDSTAHAILCILRELVFNALRHGRAQNIRVAGAIDGGILRFSVRDDGCGFDPQHVEGPSEGHFGLDGIHSRVRRLNGTLDISSSPNDTHIVISIPLPGRT